MTVFTQEFNVTFGHHAAIHYPDAIALSVALIQRCTRSSAHRFAVVWMALARYGSVSEGSRRPVANAVSRTCRITRFPRTRCFSARIPVPSHILQRVLWAVFDWSANREHVADAKLDQTDRKFRQKLRQKLASAIQHPVLDSRLNCQITRQLRSNRSLKTIRRGIRSGAIATAVPAVVTI